MAAEHNDAVLYGLQVATGLTSVLAILGRKLRLAEQFRELKDQFRDFRDEVREDIADLGREVRGLKVRQPVDTPKAKVHSLRNGSDE